MANQNFNVKIYNKCSEFDEYTLRLFSGSAKDNFFLTYSWFCNLEKFVFSKNDDNNVQYYIVSEKNVPVLIIPAYKRQVDKKLFSINYLQSLSNYYTSFYEPVCADTGKFDKAFESFVDYIRKEKITIDVISLKPLNKNRVYWKKIFRILEKKSFICEEYFCFGNWYLELNDQTFEDYFNSFPSKLKNTITRKFKKLEREKEHSFKIYSDLNDVSNNYIHYKQIYDQSWKIKESFPDFIKWLALTNAKEGNTRLGVLYIEKIPVAVQLWFIINKVAYIYKLAHDESYKQYSAGTLLTAFMMENVIDNDRVQKIDFLTGDDEYKKDWMNKRQELWGLLAYNRSTIVGKFLATKYLLLRKLKSMKKNNTIK